MFSPKHSLVTALSLCIMTLIATPFAQAVNSPVFSDVPDNSDLAKALIFLKTKGVKGYPDGTFKPANGISRIEFLTLTLKTLSVDPGTAVNKRFSDVPEKEWFAPVVSKAGEMGLVKGNPDGTFAPTNPVTLIDGLVILARAYKVDSATCKGTIPKGIEGWVAPYFSCATERGVLDGSKEYRPEMALTRGQAALLQYLYAKGAGVVKEEPAAQTVDPNAEVLKKNIEDAKAQLNLSAAKLRDKDFAEALRLVESALASAQEAKKLSTDPGVVGFAKYLYAQKQLITALMLQSTDREKAMTTLKDAIETAKQVSAMQVDASLKNAVAGIIALEKNPAQAGEAAATAGNADATPEAIATAQLQNLLNVTEQKMGEAIKTLLKKDIAGAKTLIDESVAAAKSAKEKAPENPVVLGAAKVAYAMKQFISAYELGVKGKLQDAKGVATESIATAEQAKAVKDVSNSIVTIADQIINEFAKKLIADIDKKLASTATP